MFNIHPTPNHEPFSYLSYTVTTFVGGPLLYMLFAFSISYISGEWEDTTDVARTMPDSLRPLMLGAPLLAIIYKGLFEGQVGFIYYDDQIPSYGAWYTYFGASVLYILLGDFIFYATHRFWHTPWLYKNSHYSHHGYRPVTTFAGNAADLVEIFAVGMSSTIGPAFMIPLNARVFLVLNILNQIWSIYLHNNKCHKFPPGIMDPLCHNIHHYYGQVNFNFGLYTEFWDRMLGTYRETVPIAQNFLNKRKKVNN